MTEDELILTHVLQCKRIDLYLHPPQLTSDQHHHVQEIKRRRTEGEPLQYLLGECDFMGLTLKVDRRVLIPRPETELLVEEILKRISTVKDEKEGLYALDIGTGSGNIPIAVLKQNPKWRFFALDISSDALEVARANAERHGASSAIKFIAVDVCEWLSGSNLYRHRFSLIVSNPPYIATQDLPKLPVDVQKEPNLALNGGEDGLRFYRHIISNAPHVLKPGGWLFFEIGETQRKSVENLLTAQGSFVNIKTIKDYADKDRIVLAKLST